MRRLLGLVIMVLCNGLSASGARANFNDLESGILLLQFEDSALQWVAPSLSQNVAIEVTGPVVRATVTQTFRNPGTTWANATFVFPLPETAAVDHMRLETDDRIIEGLIKEKGEAKQLYEAAKQQGRKASLVSQARNNLFTTRLANLAPGESVKVRIEYQQSVDRYGDTYSLRFPMTLTPRYIPGTPINAEDNEMSLTPSPPETDAVPDATEITPPWHPQGDNNHPTRLTVDLQPGFALGEVESLHHQVQQHTSDSEGVTLVLDQHTHEANRDFVLQWRPAEQNQPQLQLFSETRNGDSVHLLMMTPPQLDLIGELPPRELIFIVDTSGSMGGESIRQAKSALTWSLDRLRPEDTFNIIEFNSGSWSLFGSAQQASSHHIDKAKTFVGNLKARGGTEMRYALEMALCGYCRASDRLRQVIFLTDGAVGNEDELFGIIKGKLGNSRLFTIGIGSAPNSYFMRKAAAVGRGTSTHIGKIEESANIMTELFTALESPVITDIQLSADANSTLSWLPDPVPDIYAGSPLVALASGQLPNKITVTGKLAGQPWKTVIDTATRQPRRGIQNLWGRQRIEQLMDEYRYTRDDAERQRLRSQIVGVARQHHLVSAFTSLVAVDISPSRPANEKGQDHALANNSPQGTHFGLATTATPAALHLIVGFALVLLSLLGLKDRGRSHP
jgi:Ca-activated chloride channel homolog